MPTHTSDIEQKRYRLLEIVAGYGRVAVAFSADVDSTVVAMNQSVPTIPPSRLTQSQPVVDAQILTD